MAADHEDEEEGESPRQIARRERRTAGDRSAKVAHALMLLDQAVLVRLGLEGDVREVVDQARAISSNVARRREERRLAGTLRRLDLDDLERRLASVQEGGRAEARQFQLAESWRARLIEEGAPAVASFVAGVPGSDPEVLQRLVEDAQRERSTGKPRGAARALFRHLMPALRGTPRTVP